MASAADRGRHIVQLDLGGGWYGDAAGDGGVGELFEHLGRGLICEIDAGDAARGEHLRVGDVSGRDRTPTGTDEGGERGKLVRVAGDVDERIDPVRMRATYGVQHRHRGVVDHLVRAIA